MSRNWMARAFLVAALLVVTGAVWYATRQEADDRPLVEAGGTETPALQEPVAGLSHAEGAANSSSLEEVPSEVESRGPAAIGGQVSLLGGRVAGPDGGALAGAILSWTAWTSDFTANAIAKTLPSAESILEYSELATSNTEGRFDFFRTPKGLDGAQQSVLWITHPEHEARSYLLGAEASAWPDLSEVLLESASGMAARVVAGGEPAAGAKVVQRASAHRHPSRLSGELIELRSPLKEEPLVFLRVHESDATGRAVLVPTPHAHYLHAELGEQASAPWIGWGQPLVTLDMTATFTVQGTASLPAIDESWGKPRVIIHRSRAGALEEIGVMLVEDDGSFGPLRIPLLPAEEFVARLDGSTLAPQEVVFEAPPAGEQVFLDFVGETGSPVWLFGVDQAGEPILDAEVSVHWYVGNRRVEQVVRAEEQGYMLVPAVPDGELRGIIRAPGYHTRPIPTILLPEQEPRAYGVGMFRAARIEGICLQNGKPVPDFEVRHWSSTSEGTGDSLIVRGSQDGRFVIENVTPGSVMLEAFTPEYLRSASTYVEVDVSSKSAPEVTLELIAPRIARGTVVASGTREPLSGAYVQIMSSDQYYVGEPIGPPDGVALDGSFEIAKLGPGIGLIQVGAPGYGSRIVRFREAESSIEEFGVIELSPAQPLRVRILSDRPTDFSVYKLAVGGGPYVPQIRISPEGTALVEELGAGAYQISVLDQRSFMLLMMAKELITGEDWDVEFDLSGACTVSIDVLTGDEVAMPPGLFALCTLTRPGEQDLLREVLLDEHGRGVLEGVRPGVLGIWVRTGASGSVEGRGSLTIHEDDSEVSISVSLGSNRIRMRAVDREASPLSGATLEVYSSMSSTLFANARTDINGECTIEIAEGVDLIALTGAGGGVVIGLPFTFPESEEETVEVVFDPNSSLELQFGGDAIPVSGLECRLFDPIRDQSLVAPKTPDASGRVLFERIGSALYRLEVRGADCWPIELEVTAEAERRTVAVDLRRLGGLELNVRQSDGSPASRAPVELVCEDLSESVSDWIKGGQVPEASMLTNAGGKITITGIPRGHYRWSCSGASGVVAVEAGAAQVETVVLP